MNRIARGLIELLLRRVRSGTLVLIGPDSLRRYGRGAPSVTVTVRSPRAWRSLLRGSLGLADSYAAGMWETGDLTSVIRIVARNAGAVDRWRARLAPLWAPLQHARELARPATRRRRRSDIAAHYDLGDQLFARMLDPSLTYSCAYFERPGMSLEEAQRTKMDLICDKLALGPEHRVLEIGTGWGSFALHAAATRGCRVTTTTISENQFAYATEQARRAGLSDRVTVLPHDYRDLQGQYDRLVSIEMIEAVGWRHTPSFLKTCSRLLTADGAMLLQAITIDDRIYDAEKTSRSFIKAYIFPGGSLPSLASLTRDLSRETDLRLTWLFELTEHYVPTLRLWRESFLAHREELARLGYDERFQRIWMLYLAYCEAGFAERRIGDFQLLLTKPACRLGQEPAAGRGSAADSPARNREPDFAGAWPGEPAG